MEAQTLINGRNCNLIKASEPDSIAQANNLVLLLADLVKNCPFCSNRLKNAGVANPDQQDTGYNNIPAIGDCYQHNKQRSEE
jgi:hypothetical protein